MMAEIGKPRRPTAPEKNSARFTSEQTSETPFIIFVAKSEGKKKRCPRKIAFPSRDIEFIAEKEQLCIYIILLFRVCSRIRQKRALDLVENASTRVYSTIIKKKKTREKVLLPTYFGIRGFAN